MRRRSRGLVTVSLMCVIVCSLRHFSRRFPPGLDAGISNLRHRIFSNIVGSNVLSDVEHFEGERSKCSPPKLNAFSRQVMQLIDSDFHVGSSPDCMNNHESRFQIDYNSRIIIPKFTSVQRKYQSCCFKTLARTEEQPDIHMKWSLDCIPINYNMTVLTAAEEFIQILCTNTETQQLFYHDVLHHIPRKDFVELDMNRLRKSNAKRSNANDRLKVQIIGMDSVSNMNFIRFLPKTREFLLKNLHAVEFKGHNIVGDGSYGNLISILTGMTPSAMKDTCIPSPDRSYDSCPFIWKDFAGWDYKTLHAEDHAKYGVLTHHENIGLRQQLIDNDLHTMALNAEQNNVAGLNKSNCWDSRLSFEVLLDNILKAAMTFSNPEDMYFQWTWTTALAHSYEKMLKFDDELFLRTLKQLLKMKLMSNTALIIISGHGGRLSESRRKTDQGYIEERMPVLYIALPPSFRRSYPLAMKNLRRNSHLLTTHFDLHETLKEFWDVINLSDDNLKSRIKDGDYASRRGISLFLTIPTNRTCESAGVLDQYCVCLKTNDHEMSLIHAATDDELNRVSSIAVVRLGQATVDHINNIVANASECQRLHLSKIISAQSVNGKKADAGSSNKVGLNLVLKVATMPGGNVFESVVVEKGNSITVGSIQNVGPYEDTSLCQTLPSLKPFCFCQPENLDDAT